MLQTNGEADRIQKHYLQWEKTYDRGSSWHQFAIEERNESLQRILSQQVTRPLSQCRILDIGCGYGDLLKWFHEHGVPGENLFGVDLLRHRIEAARAMHPTFVFIEGNAEQLGFPDGWFTLVTLFTVISSILDREMARNVARNISRVLAHDGAVVWYDFRYPSLSNPGVRAMTRRRIRELFPHFQQDLEKHTLLPPIARRLGRSRGWLSPVLTVVPLLQSHYLGLLRPLPLRQN